MRVRKKGKGRVGGRGRRMRGEQQVVVMETGKIVTRLTSTVLMGQGGGCWESANE